MLIILLLQISCIRSQSGTSVSDDLIRFRNDCLQAKRLFASDQKGSLEILARWEKKSTFRSSALLAKLMLVSPVERPSASRIIMQMESEPYGSAHFNLARFAFFPPYAAVSQADFMEPLRIQALDAAVNKDPTSWLRAAGPERRDKAYVTPMSTLFTAAQAYLRMGMYRRAEACGRKLKALANKVNDPRIGNEWLENANQCLDSAKLHSAPQRILYPDT
jgi:hypothetical protein